MRYVSGVRPISVGLRPASDAVPQHRRILTSAAERRYLLAIVLVQRDPLRWGHNELAMETSASRRTEFVVAS